MIDHTVAGLSTVQILNCKIASTWGMFKPGIPTNKHDSRQHSFDMQQKYKSENQRHDKVTASPTWIIDIWTLTSYNSSIGIYIYIYIYRQLPRHDWWIMMDLYISMDPWYDHQLWSIYHHINHPRHGRWSFVIIHLHQAARGFSTDTLGWSPFSIECATVRPKWTLWKLAIEHHV